MSAKVKWPCKFPDRWTVLPSKRLFPESKDRAPESDEQLSATQEYGVISQAEFMRLAGRRVVQLNQNLELRKRVEIGDFVISMRSFQGGLERAWAEGGIRSSYVVLRPKADLVPGYYQRLFKSVDYIQALQSTANFIRDGQDMNYQNFVLIDLPFPPVSEQFCIAAFLDHETARIDALIEEQQRLIELLKEKRQAVISHAVTKGLDPTVPMKDSGVEWLGDAPAHWEITPLKYVVSSLGQGWSPQCDNFPAEDGEWGVLKVGCVNGGVFNPAENKRLPDELEPDAGITVKQGDLLISRANSRELVGSAAVAAKDYPWLMLCDKIYRLRLNAERAFPEFLAHYLGSSAPRGQIELAASGASDSMQNISQSVLMEMPLTLPPLREQKVILQFLSDTLKSSDELVAEVTNQRCLLQERRSALISAAVTGKIDVRGWQPPASAPSPELVLEAV